MGIRRTRSPRPSALPATIDRLEPRRLLAATAPTTIAFGGPVIPAITDSDGTTARFTLPAGLGSLTVADDGSVHVTLTKSAASTLQISSTGGDGRFNIAEIKSAKPNASVNATKAKLTGATTLTNIATLTLDTATDLELTSTTPLTSLTASSWTDADAIANDSLTAPSISKLNIKGNFAPALKLTSAKSSLSSASVGGTVTGVWAVSGSAGSLKFHSVRSPDLSVKGTINQLTLDDRVALVPSANTGTLHLGGKASAVSAAQGKDKFQTPKNTTLYTGAADVYSYDTLFQLTRPSASWTHKTDGWTHTDTNLPPTMTADGRTLYTVETTGPNAGDETYYIDPAGGAHLLSLTDGSSAGTSFSFADLPISPPVFHPGQTFRSSGNGSGSLSVSGVTSIFHGTMKYSAHFVGHELVTTPSGTFLAVKLQSTLSGTFTGSASKGSFSTPVTLTMNLANTDWVVPDLGDVKSDSAGTTAVALPALHYSKIQKSTSHSVLVAGPA